MSWGIRITILYLGFVGIILTLAFVCFGEKVELESADYYAKELKFQDQLDATENLNALPQSVSHVIRDRSIQLLFPQDLISGDFKGTVNFLRPSDASKDRMVQLAPGVDGIQMIDPGFIKGVYKMQISFSTLGKTYFKEDVINFN